MTVSLACPESVLRKYDGMCWARARDHYCPGLDEDDLYQEARIALCRAYGDFDPTAGRGFGSFAWLCITRHLWTVIKNAQREKRQGQNLASSLETPVDGERPLAEVLPGPEYEEPLAIVLARERFSELMRAFQRCSPMEQRAVICRMNGVPYAGDKSIDNALQRARRKLAA